MSGWNSWNGTWNSASDTALGSPTAAALPQAVAVAVACVGALVVGGLLLFCFWLGRRWMVREPPVPGPDGHGRIPDEGPVRETSQRRELDEMPRYEERDRLTPHEMPGFGNVPSRPSSEQQQRKWSPGSSGPFGSGGSGSVR